jgi:alpha-tubulin suppressor-like RCC1 family protein
MKKAYRRLFCLVSVFTMSFLIAACGKVIGNTDVLPDNISTESKTDNKYVSGYERKRYIAAGNFSYAVTASGEILQAGNSENVSSYSGITIMPEVDSWKDIKYIDADGFSVCAIDNAGKVYGDGMENDTGEVTLSMYKNIQQVVTDRQVFTVLNDSDRLICVGSNAPSWSKTYGLISGIAYIDVSNSHTAVLKKDGKVSVFCEGVNEDMNTSQWADMIDVACGYNFTAGLKKDGTVVAVGDNDCGQCDINEWKNIVLITAYHKTLIGLKSDGTVVATGDNSKGQCEISAWNNVVSIMEGNGYTLGIKKDGTAVAVGDNKYGQCDVENWKNIQQP